MSKGIIEIIEGSNNSYILLTDNFSVYLSANIHRGVRGWVSELTLVVNSVRSRQHEMNGRGASPVSRCAIARGNCHISGTTGPGVFGCERA